MPTSHINDSKHWRDRAAEMRALSDEMKHAETIAMMLRLADDYDKMADRADARSKEDVARRNWEPQSAASSFVD